MADAFNESFNPEAQGGQSEGVSEAAREAFREQQRSAQAAKAQLKRDEGKAKTFDNTLAVLVSQLLQQGGHDHVVVLVASLVESNIPSDVTLAILSLEYETAYQRAMTVLQSFQDGQTQLVQKMNVSELAVFSPNIQSQLLTWAERIIANALKDAGQVLETIIHVDTWQIHPSLTALSRIMIMQFAEKNGVHVSLEEADDFTNRFFHRLQNTLQEHLMK